MIPALARFWEEKAKAPTEHEANGWSERSHAIRMVCAVDVADLQPGDTVLDWGCGTGRMLDFLGSGIRYLGVDPSQAMIDRAIRERPENEADFVCSPCLPIGEYDHVFALGCWNVKPWQPEWTWEQITALWTSTRKKLIVSLLRSAGDDVSVTYDPLDAVRWAKSLSPRYWLDCAYLSNDMLLGLER